MNYNTVVANIEKPNFKEKTVKKYQKTDDIIKDLIYCFKEYNYQAKPIAEMYKTGNLKTDGKNIYDFIKKNIAYDAEPERDQTTRSFSRIIHDKWGDCKHTATIVGSIGWNEGYNVIFRVVRYVDSKGDFIYHVYSILEDKQGNKVIVDPLQSFNYEKKYDKKIGDFKAINNMTLSRLTGTSNMQRMPQQRIQKRPMQRLQMGQPIPRAMHGMDLSGISDDYDSEQVGIIDGIGGRELIFTPMGLNDSAIGEIEELEGVGRKTKAQRKQKKAARQEKRAAKKETRQEKRQEKKVVRKEKRQVRREKIKSKLQKGGKILKKVSLAPVRGAFSALLLVNFKSLATRLQKAIDTGHGNKVAAFAKKFGYNENILRSQIKKGSTKKSIGAIDENEIYDVDGVGFVVTGAAIATASTAIAAALALLKALGLNQKGDSEEISKAADNIENSGGQTFEISPSSGGSSADYSPSSGGGASDYSPSSGGGASDYSPSNDGADTKAGEKEGFLDKLKSIPTPVIVVGSALVVYVAGKKFKWF